MVFGLSWLSIPLYKLFCEHVGLDGDTQKKDYSMNDKEGITYIKSLQPQKI